MKPVALSNTQREDGSPHFFQPGSRVDLMMLTCCWWLAILLVNPVGNFPLNDDWAFGMTVRRFLQMGIFRPSGWESMSLLTQSLWGALFCVPFGFSFTVLRCSTLILALLGIFSMYMIVRFLNCSRWLALCITFTVALNPLYFSLSFTFMTDIPFMGFSALSLLFFVRSLLSDAKFSLHWIFGTCLAIVAILCRQIGLFLPLAFGLTLLVKDGISLSSLFRALFPPSAGYYALFAYQQWLQKTEKIPVSYGRQVRKLFYVLKNPSIFIPNFFHNSIIALLYLGLFLLPVLLLFFS